MVSKGGWNEVWTNIYQTQANLEIILLDSFIVNYLTTIGSFQTQESAKSACCNKISTITCSEIKVSLISSSFLTVSCYFYVNPDYFK